MADALRALKAVKGFLEAARIRLVECSQEGRALQKSALGAHEPITSWHETLDDVPPLPSIVIANEFIDCLPVRQLVYDEQANAWRERRVTHQRGAFSFVRAEFAADATPMADAPPADGEIFEVRPAVPKLVDAFAAIARLHPLAALIIDYGYEKPSLGNSVQAARAHGFVDLFDAPGESDVTAHVDFSSLIAEAREKGFNAFGPMPMGAFLLRLGIGARAAQLMSRLPAAEAEALRKGMVRLTSPDQMGVLFKAIVLTSGEGISPAPF
jgi:NADH dehydrogenase [ubiquinone] 1 alpha subcomplex assembly factor 7